MTFEKINADDTLNQGRIKINNILDAVDSQVSELKSDIGELESDLRNFDYAKSSNMIDISNVIDGKVIISDGNINDGENYCITDYIPINCKEPFYIAFVTHICFYNENHEFLGRENGWESWTDRLKKCDYSSTTLASKASYCRLNIKIPNKLYAQLTAQNVRYLPYKLKNMGTFITEKKGFLDNRNTLNFGCVPTVPYFGQHEDTTRLNQNSTVSETLEVFEQLRTDGSYYITREELGVTEDGYRMYVYKVAPPITNPSGKKHPKIILVSGLHGHEKTGTYALAYLLKDLLDNSTKNPVLNYIRSSIELVILPCVNGWGWDNNNRLTKLGINLNRNFPCSNWHDFDNDTSYTEAGNYNSRGSAPLSEIHSRYIKKVIEENEDALCMIDIHTNGTNTQKTWDICVPIYSHKFYDAYDAKMAEVCENFLCTLRPLLDDVYGVNKTKDYVYGTTYATENKPELHTWVADSGRMMACLFEGTPGSANDYLGNKLTLYSPDVIKLNAEMITNFIMHIINAYRPSI